MRVKTSVSLSSELLSQVARYAEGGERSEFIEKALWNYVAFLRRKERDAADRERIDGAASFLNAEAKDILEYQVSL